MGISFKKIGAGLEQFGKSVGGELKQAGKNGATAIKDAVTGHEKEAGKAAVSAFKDVGESAFDAAAESVGVAELVGLRYPVKSYSTPLDSHLTRGSRLSDQDFAQLHQEGFKSTVNLCLENNDDAPRAAALGMNSLHLEILDNSAPTEAQAKQFLDFVTSPQNQPAYVHCEAGQGRTGVMSAVYRMAVQGWTPEAAIAEAKQMGMKVPAQLEFLQQFGADLQAGKIAGYPKQ